MLKKDFLLHETDLSKTLQILTYLFDWLYFTQCLTSFFSIDHLLRLCARFLILFPLTEMRFSPSTHLLMFLSLETLTSIRRTGLPILVELIDLVNSVTFFLSQVTLLRWLTFLFRFQTVILIVLPFLDLFISSDASICSKMTAPLLGNFDHVVVSVSIDFPSNSQLDASFHCIA